ncbi:hypothetical protein, partial [Klebsiella pneumoniae]|uniref:hypothetical protein n=1 Tax=Klebsiella pneumoniae TaxID=573 RepID=UPI001C8191C5
DLITCKRSEYLLIFSPVDVLIICESILSKRKTSRYTLITSGWAVMVSRYRVLKPERLNVKFLVW